MSHTNRLHVPGTETHGRPGHRVSVTPSPKFLHDVARFLETEPDDALAEPDDVGPDGVQATYSRPDRGSYKWDAASGRGDPHDLASSPSLY